MVLFYQVSHVLLLQGVDPQTGAPYEQTFCSSSDMRGMAVLGDSISAHFHLPREWFNTSEISAVMFLFYTLPHNSGGVLWFQVGRPCVSLSARPFFVSG